MKRILLAVPMRVVPSAGFIIGLVFLVCTVAAAQPPQGSPPHMPGELLVHPRAGVPDFVLDKIFNQHGAWPKDIIPGIDVLVLKVPEDRLEVIEEALSHNPNFEFVEKNFVAEVDYIPNDPKYPAQWHLPKISAPFGWDISVGDYQTILAVIDSGADPFHPDLGSRLLPGYNFLDDTTDTSDLHGHGTSVSGTTAALSDNLTGVAGVTWENPILPLVVVNRVGGATYDDIASAIIYAADNGARVINISLGKSSHSSTLQNAVNYAWNNGVVIVAAAGNGGDSTPMYPAALDNVIAASATDQSDDLASFSSYGDWVDLSAPGVSILTTSRGGGYGYRSGTSFSSPIIAGLAALVFSINPDLTNAQVVELMEQNSDDLGTPGYDIYFGYGRVNIYETLLTALETVPTPDTTPPSANITSPSDGSTVSGMVPVDVTATDDVGVVKMELYLDGTYFATDATSPYSFAWNANEFSNGSHTLTAYAYDAADNVGVSEEVVVKVANGDTVPPDVEITSPRDGDTVRRHVKIRVSATDNVRVVKVELYIDGKLHKSNTDLPYFFRWNTRKVAPGSYTLEARAYDAAGNTGTYSITVYK